jgi:hypothetical protein
MLVGPGAAILSTPPPSFCEAAGAAPEEEEEEEGESNESLPGPPSGGGAAPSSAGSDAGSRGPGGSSWWRLWRRRFLAPFFKLPPPPLGLPRRVLPHDPDLVLPESLREQRQRDEAEARILQRQIHDLLVNRFNSKRASAKEEDEDRRAHVGALVGDLYRVLYGDGVTPRSRQEFLERHGCTGWTPEALDELLRLASEGVPGNGSGSADDGGDPPRRPRGIVEIGAGNGQ